jgi:putative ABC transport system permease protein
MIDRRWRKVWRDAWLHKARTLLVAAAMTIGLIAAGALLDTWALVERVTATTYLASNPVEATLRLDRIDAGLVDAVRNLPPIAAVRTRRTAIASVQAGASAHRAVLYALDDYDRSDIGRLLPDRGKWPPADVGIIIERSALEFSGATVGEPVQVAIGAGPARSLNVDGIVRDVSLAPGWMENLVYGFVTPATLEKLGAPAGFDELQFRLRDPGADRAAVRRVAREVRELAESRGARVLNVEVPEPGRHVHAAQMDSLMLVQGAFGLLTLLVCALLVVNLVSAMLTGQVREIGIMKSIGSGTVQIARMYFVFALALGVIASAAALPAALAIGRAYAGFKVEMLNFPLAGQAMPGWAIALQLVVGCLIPVVAAAVPVWRGCRLPVADALRDVGIPAASVHHRRTIAVEGIGRPLLLSIGNAFRKRGRLIATLLTLAAGGTVYLGAANLRTGVVGSVDRLFVTQHFDFALRFGANVARVGVEKATASIDGIATAETWGGARATRVLGDGTQGDAFAILGVPVPSQMLDGTVDNGRWLHDGDERSLVVGRALLRNDPELGVGAKVTLSIDDQPSTWTVIGTIDAGPQPVAYATRSGLAALRDDHAAALVVRTSARGAALQLDAIQRLRTALEQAGIPVTSSQRIEETRRVVEDHLLMVVQFLGAMSWVMIAVGGMSLASTMSLAVLERTREIGVLRAIGARHRDILLLVQAESLVIAVLAWLIALPLSVPVGIALGDAFGRIMFEVPRVWLPPVSGVAAWLALVVVLALIASAWPAARAMRVPAAVALAYE